jgi:protein-disulfide isomerase
MTPAAIVDALASNKGLALFAPAILLLGATLAIGQNTPAPAPAPVPAAATAPAPTAATTTTTAAPAQPPPAATSTAKQTAAADAPFSPARRQEIESIIKEYLIKSPEVLLEAQHALESKLDKIQAERTAVAIKNNAAEIFHPAASPVVGNAKGDVTIIEFFDYNCGYCKRAFSHLARLVENDKQVKLILKEFPILSKGSEEASRVALAAKLQGKYWEFHQAMIQVRGQVNEAAALRVAEKIKLDMVKLKADMASPAVKKEIDDTRALAVKLGIQGTPHFLVGDRIIPGAPENLYEQMSKLVAQVRKEGCSVC